MLRRSMGSVVICVLFLGLSGPCLLADDGRAAESAGSVPEQEGRGGRRDPGRRGSGRRQGRKKSSDRGTVYFLSPTSILFLDDGGALDL